jgi:hypothetical protein
MSSKLSIVRFPRADTVRLRLQAVTKFCISIMRSVFVSLLRPSKDELPSIIVLAELTARVFQNSRGISLSKIYAPGHG